MPDPTPTRIDLKKLSRRDFLKFSGLATLGLAAEAICASLPFLAYGALKTTPTPGASSTPGASPSPTNPNVLRPTPTTVPGETIQGETLAMGGAQLRLSSMSGAEIAKAVQGIGSEYKTLKVLVNDKGFSDSFIGFAGENQTQVALVAQGPKGFIWDAAKGIWNSPSGDLVFIPDVILPGTFDEIKNTAGPSALADHVFLAQNNLGYLQAGVIYPADVVAKLQAKGINIKILADGSGRGLFLGNQKIIPLEKGQSVKRDANGDLIRLNADGSYQKMITSWGNVKRKDQLYQVGAFAGPVEAIPEVPYPPEKLLDIKSPDSPIVWFANKMKMAGYEISTDQIKDNLIFEKSTDINGNPYIIVRLKFDPDPNQQGEVLENPVLFIWDKEVGWKSQTITYLLKSQGIKFGFTYDWKNNPYRKITRPPDSLVVENSKILSPEDSFYVPFIFETSTRTSWKSVDEYISFINKYNIDGGAPIIVGQAESNWVLDLEQQHSDKAEARQFFSDLLYKQTFDIVNHSKEDIHGWTINELFNENGTMKDRLWLRTIGPDYAEIATKAIRDADPNTYIVINDGKQEYVPALDGALYKYVSQLKEKGILKDGDIIGFQGHNGILFNKSKDQIKQIVQKYIDLGLKVRFTELDVFDVKDQKKETLIKKAQIFINFIEAAIELNRENKVNGKGNVVDVITVWGTTHGSSWLLDIGKPGEYPLLYNDDGTPELTYYLVATSIAKLISQQQSP